MKIVVGFNFLKIFLGSSGQVASGAKPLLCVRNVCRVSLNFFRVIGSSGVWWRVTAFVCP